MALPLTISQRGVGCTQVVKPPFVMRYLSGPIFSIVLAVEIHVRLERAEHAAVALAALAELRDAAARC